MGGRRKPVAKRAKAVPAIKPEIATETKPSDAAGPELIAASTSEPGGIEYGLTAGACLALAAGIYGPVQAARTVPAALVGATTILFVPMTAWLGVRLRTKRVRQAAVVVFGTLAFVGGLIYVIVDDPDSSSATSIPSAVPPASLDARPSTTLSSRPASPRATSPTDEHLPFGPSIRRMIAPGQSVYVFDNALLIGVESASVSSAIINLSTRTAHCSGYRNVAQRLLLLDPVTGLWFEVALRAVTDGRSVTVEVERGRGSRADDTAC